MQITALDGTRAICRPLAGDDAEQEIDLSLIDGATIGGHVLVFLGRATDVLSSEDARKTSDALEAVSLARTGGDFDHLLADLIDRTPELPAHLQAPQNSE